jgi:hypothetical protein
MVALLGAGHYSLAVQTDNSVKTTIWQTLLSQLINMI